MRDAVVTVLQPQPVPVDSGVQIPFVGDVDDDFAAFMDFECGAGDGAVVAQHPDGGVAQLLTRGSLGDCGGLSATGGAAEAIPYTWSAVLTSNPGRTRDVGLAYFSLPAPIAVDRYDWTDPDPHSLLHLRPRRLD